MDSEDLPEGYHLEDSSSSPPQSDDSNNPPAGYKLEEPSDAPPPGYQLEEDKYSTPLEQAKTVAENFAQGMAGPLATGFEKNVLGVNPEDIIARQRANPGEEISSNIAGNMALAYMLPPLGVAKNAGLFAKIGSTAIKGMIVNGLIEGGDEYSKAILGHGDPSDVAAAHIVKASGIGLLIGGIFGASEHGLNKGLNYLENKKVGERLINYISGIGHASTFPIPEGIPSEEIALKQMANIPEEMKTPQNISDFKKGQSDWEKLSKIPGKTAKTAVEYKGAVLGGPWGYGAAKTISPSVEKIVNKNFSKAGSKYLGPTILKAAASNKLQNLSQIINYATDLESGVSKINKGVDALFKSGGDQYLNFPNSESDREKLRYFQENGGMDSEINNSNMSQSSQGFAEGGQVKEQNEPNDLSEIFPEQNVMMNATKMRVSNYLNSSRPLPKLTNLPYDSERKDAYKEHQYNQTLDMANQPLSILKKIKDGSLLPKHVTDLNSMYPELYNHLSKKITEKIMKSKLNGNEKPPYHMRQSLSLFLGSNLDSTLTQPNMMAAQNVFLNQKAQKMNPPNTKSSLSKIGMSAQTAEQSRTQDLNKS